MNDAFPEDLTEAQDEAGLPFPAPRPIPQLACCNFIPNVAELRDFAREHGFAGVDWTFEEDTLPRSLAAEHDLALTLGALQPLEVRYHCALSRTDPGEVDPEQAARAATRLRQVCRLVARLGGRHLTIHVGLGRASTVNLGWEESLASLEELGRYASNLRVNLCLENLAWGWTSRPDLYEKLIRKTGAWGTLDIGHARVSPAVISGHYEVEDFVTPHPGRILNAHVYHEENEDGHQPPQRLEDLRDRLALLRQLPNCDWWVLELREEGALMKTLGVVRKFFRQGAGTGPTEAAQPELGNE